MMALTRASKKRDLDKASGSSRGEIPPAKKAKTGRKTGKAPALAAKQKKPEKEKKSLLDMPPEIRNRIYHFAAEAQDFNGWEDAVPLVSRCASLPGKSQWPTSRFAKMFSARNYLGLTQACTQLRREYRPIWLRNSMVRVLLHHATGYIHSFYGCSPNYVNLPKLLQISYDHELQDNVNLTPLLRMRAACPTFVVKFIPHLLTQDDGPWVEDFDDPEDCGLCVEEMKDGEFDPEAFEELGCPHENIRRLGFGDYFLEADYPYLEPLNQFLAHDNPKWLEDIRSREVVCVKLDTAAQGRDFPDVSIRLAADGAILGKELKEKTMSQAARDYVNSRELKKTNTFGSNFNTFSSNLHFELLVCASCVD